MSSQLDDFFNSHDLDFLHRINGWVVEAKGEAVLLELGARDGERYKVMFICDNYPTEAPKSLFVNDEGSSNEQKAWPKGNQQFYEIVKLPPNSFLCMPLTREGLQHHQDWKSNPSVNSWNSNRHTLMDLFNFIQRLLNSDNYTGRGA
mgnify:CR=1 FL=1